MASSMAAVGARQFCNLCHKLSLSRITCRYYSEAAAQTPHESDKPVERLVIPKRRKRDDLAVLRALAGTVGKDPTASPYSYHDDPYLLPKTPMERRKYLFSAESGRKAAELVIKSKPHLFHAYQHDEPKIEAYYPPTRIYVFTEPSEDAIMERLDVLDLKNAAEIHKQLIEAGKSPSMDVSNYLLEVLCYYNSESPMDVLDVKSSPQPEPKGIEAGETEGTEAEDTEAPEVDSVEAEEVPPATEKQPLRGRQLVAWKDGDANAAQALFDSLEAPDSRSYNTLLRGMIKHGAHSKAYNLFNEMQGRGIQTSLEGYNALISVAASIRVDFKERWDVLLQLLKQMQAENIRPNIFTFNNLLACLRTMGEIGRRKAFQTLGEMKAINVEPSLATYDLILTTFYKDTLPPNDVIYEVLDAIEGQEFTYQDPRDVEFFKNAMNICFNLKDVRLAYQLDALFNTGENYKLGGSNTKQSLYYSKFLHLICLMDSADAMFEYYEKCVPWGFIPTGNVFVDMMRSVQTAGCLDKLSHLWKDMCLYGSRSWQEPLDLLLQIMATADSTDLKLFEQFAVLCKDIEKAHIESLQRRNPLRWSMQSLNHLTMVYVRAEDKDSAWSALAIYKEQSLVPGQAILEDFIDLCLKTDDVSKAMECVSLAVERSLAFAPALAEKLRQHDGLTTEQSVEISKILSREESVPEKDG